MSQYKFPDFPDNPNPGGEGGGGDHVPYIDPAEHRLHILSAPVVTEAWYSNGHLHFRFQCTGPIMRFNIVWSRPGRDETDMRWVDPSLFSASEEYIINELTVPETDYVFKVQSKSRELTLQFNGPYSPYTYGYNESVWVETRFFTPARRHVYEDSVRELTMFYYGSAHDHSPYRDGIDEPDLQPPHLPPPHRPQAE